MKLDSQVSIQALVFALVASSFTVVYITQPVLPVLETEFGTDARTASLSVSAVIFAIALANLPFGALVDRYPIKPIILIGGSVIRRASQRRHGILCRGDRGFVSLPHDNGLSLPDDIADRRRH